MVGVGGGSLRAATAWRVLVRVGDAGKAVWRVEIAAMEDTATQSPIRSAATTRRQILMRAGLALSGALGADLLAAAHARPDEPQAKILVGSGSNRYECVHDWLVPPSHIAWGDTQGVAQDSKGNIYVTHTVGAESQSKDAIVVFDRKGKFQRSFGARFQGGGHGIEIRKEKGKEYAYHCDTARRQVVKTDLEGNVIWEKGFPKDSSSYKEGMPFVPTNIAFAPNGDFYVADGYGSDFILRYDINGNLVQTFGGKGTGPGQFQTAHGITVDTRGKEPLLVVTERATHRIQYLTLDGKHVRWATEGMRLPCYFDTRGDQLLVPDLEKTVTILDSADKVVAQLCDGATITDLPGRGRKRSEWIPGKFVHPHGGIFLKNGDILVAEWLPIGRMTLLRKV